MSNSSNYTKDVVVFFDGLYKFEISVNSPWMLDARQGTRELVAHTYEEVDFKKVFITEKEMRKRKLKNLIK